ncbi:MAG TPA: hypothetical protein VGO50_00775 [Pyrinomonadaceae bacterium]|jgi:hypothetical protein|nr:hypothetical protein [Pyrinomonadaceae bacterium]
MKQQNNSESGFGIWSVILLLALIAFIVLAVMKTITVLAAVIGFIAVFILILFFATLPDIMRYVKISSM